MFPRSVVQPLTGQALRRAITAAIKIAEPTNESDTDPLPRACVRFESRDGLLVVCANNYFNGADFHTGGYVGNITPFSIRQHDARALLSFCPTTKTPVTVEVAPNGAGNVAKFDFGKEGFPLSFGLFARAQWWKSHEAIIGESFKETVATATVRSGNYLAKVLKGLKGYTVELTNEGQNPLVTFTGEPFTQWFVKHQLIECIEYSKEETTLTVRRQAYGHSYTYLLTTKAADSVGLMTARRTKD